MATLLAHESENEEEELPGLEPAGRRQRIALRADWPDGVTRDWAWGGSTGSGRPRLHPRQRRRARPPAGRRRRRRGRRLDRRRTASVLVEEDDAGRPLRPRHRVRGDRPRARARTASSTACACSAPASPAAAPLLLAGPALGDRAGLRRHQHEPLDDEEAVRRRAARARRRRVLPPHGARRLGAQHAGRELPVALLVGDLGRQPRGGRPARVLLQPAPRRSSSSRAASTSRSPGSAARRSAAPATASRRRTSPASAR